MMYRPARLYRMAKWIPVPEIIDPVFAKTSQNARFLLSENERFGLVFVKTGSINSGTGLLKRLQIRAGTNSMDPPEPVFLNV